MITYLSTSHTVQQSWLDIKVQFCKKTTGQFTFLIKENANWPVNIFNL